MTKTETTTTAPMIRVDITEDEDGLFSVFPVFANVDRPTSSGWGGVRDRKLAERLAAAIRDGVAIGPVTIKVGVNGKSYPSYEHKVLGRVLNADLRRLGY